MKICLLKFLFGKFVIQLLFLNNAESSFSEKNCHPISLFIVSSELRKLNGIN